MKVEIGISEKDRAAIAGGLSRLLADSYTLYLKTHNYHWNVTGPQFRELDLMFEEHYTELAVAVDEIAERIRALYPEDQATGFREGDLRGVFWVSYPADVPGGD